MNEFPLAEAFVQLQVSGETTFNTVMDRVRANVKRLGETLERMSVHAKRLLLVGTGVMTWAVKQMADQEQAERRLESVLRATGEAAGWSAAQLNKMASDLQRVTAFGDDTTLGAMRMLLAFRAIKGDVFRRAVEASQDLATHMGTDLASAALQLGKALDDPTVGLTLLRRRGITFSESQQKVIKSLWETGQHAKAQGVILDALAAKMGGLARADAQTFAGSLKMLKNQVGDLAEEIGGALFPVLKKLSGKLMEVVESMRGLSTAQKDNIETWSIFGVSALGGLAILPRLISGFGKLATGIGALGGVGAGPMGALIMAVTALGAAMLTAYLRGEKLGDTLERLLELTRDLDAMQAGEEATNKANREFEEGIKSKTPRALEAMRNEAEAQLLIARERQAQAQEGAWQRRRAAELQALSDYAAAKDTLAYRLNVRGAAVRIDMEHAQRMAEIEKASQIPSVSPEMRQLQWRMNVIDAAMGPAGTRAAAGAGVALYDSVKRGILDAFTSAKQAGQGIGHMFGGRVGEAWMERLMPGGAGYLAGLLGIGPWVRKWFGGSAKKEAAEPSRQTIGTVGFAEFANLVQSVANPKADALLAVAKDQKGELARVNQQLEKLPNQLAAVLPQAVWGD